MIRTSTSPISAINALAARKISSCLNIHNFAEFLSDSTPYFVDNKTLHNKKLSLSGQCSFPPSTTWRIIPRTHLSYFEVHYFCKVFSLNLIYFLNKEYFIPIEHFVNKKFFSPLLLYCFSLTDKYSKSAPNIPHIFHFSAKQTVNSLISSNSDPFSNKSGGGCRRAHSPTASPIFST